MRRNLKEEINRMKTMMNVMGEVSDETYKNIKDNYSNARIIMSKSDNIEFKPTPNQEISFKPKGLWYGIGDSWISWVKSEMPDWENDNVFMIEINENLILRITNYNELVEFEDKYSTKNLDVNGGKSALRARLDYKQIDWSKVAKDFAGIEIAPYIYKARYEHMWYYGWDIASGCIWGEGVITKVTKLNDEQITNIPKSDGIQESDPKTGTGKKPEGSGRRLYTDENPSDTVSVKFRTKEDIVDTLNKDSFKSKPHNRQSQIINLIHQRVRVAYQNAKDPETKKRLKRAYDYIENVKERSKEKTIRLRKVGLGENKEEQIAEIVTDKEVICNNCGWSWNKNEGGNDMYICHKCGTDNEPYNQLNEEVEKITWGEVAQLLQALKSQETKQGAIESAKGFGRLGASLLPGFDFISNALDVVDNLNNTASVAKALFGIAKNVTQSELKSPKDSKFKQMTGAFWDAIKLSSELSEMLDDKTEAAFINQVILPMISKPGNENEPLPNMDIELGKWLNEKGLKTKADIHFTSTSGTISEQTFMGNFVWNHVKDITPDEDDVPWGFKDKIRTSEFENVPNFNLESLLETDPDFREYYESDDVRYEEDEMNPRDIELEIVVVNGELLDGYSRAATLLRNGQKTTNAFVGKNITMNGEE